MINYVIGRYRIDGSIAGYMDHNREVRFDNLEFARNYLKWVNEQFPDKDYRIFILHELKNDSYV